MNGLRDAKARTGPSVCHNKLLRDALQATISSDSPTRGDMTPDSRHAAAVKRKAKMNGRTQQVTENTLERQKISKRSEPNFRKVRTGIARIHAFTPQANPIDKIKNALPNNDYVTHDGKGLRDLTPEAVMHLK